MDHQKNVFLRAFSSLAGSISFIFTLSILFSFFGKFWWVFDLASHFRLQYAIGSVPLIPILFLLKRRVFAVVFLTLSIANAIALAPHLNTSQKDNETGEYPFKALLLNVNTRLGNPEKVVGLIIGESPDFFVLQEINRAWQKDIERLKKQYPYQVLETREDNFGIGLFSKHPFISSEILYLDDLGFPSISAEIAVSDIPLNIISTHTLPPRNNRYSEIRNQQLSQLASYLSNVEGPTILLGDLNTTPYNYYFKKLIENSGFMNSSKEHGLLSSWPSFAPLLGIQIDHILHSKEITIERPYLGEKVGSDHFPLITNFKINSNRTQKPSPK